MNEIKSESGPRFLDLFAGIGGLSIGFERAGFEPLGGVDNWPDAVATFEHNSGHTCLCSDLSTMSVNEIEASLGIESTDIDVLVGGPPCQGFSTVGKRDEFDPRNQLWRHFRDLVSEIRPAYVVIENVAGMWVMQNGAVREQVISGFARAGYLMKAEVLRAADFGVPQLRKRVFFFGWLPTVAAPSFPQRLAARHVSVSDAIFDLPKLGPGEQARSYTKSPTTDFQIARRGLEQILHNHEAANHAPHLVEILEHIPDGGNRKSIPDHLQPSSGFHNSYARLASWKPAVAVTSNMRKPSSARATHPLQPRGLTVREGLRLQSFDDCFHVLGSRTSQYQQVGNAVPPLLAEAVGKAVMRAWRQNTPERIRESRSDWKPVNPIQQLALL